MTTVERFEIPTPFQIGRVNTYCFSGDALTLIDPGPATEEAYEELVIHIEELGYAVADVERILITHPHMDHFGIASRIKERSDAQLLAHADAANPLADPSGLFDREQAFFRPFFVSMGVPRQIVDTVIELPEPYAEFREPVAVDRELADGEIVDVAAEMETVHTPGHAPGSVCFVARSDGVAFTGDHVLRDVSPNPLLTLAPDTPTERTRSLPVYLESLRKLRAVDVQVGYPGHGESIPDLHSRIDEILTHHDDRKETIADMLAEMGPTTAHRLMQELFPDLPVTEMFPGMSEIIGHLDLLEDAERVAIVDEDGVKQYALR